jgi:hypothetical protein
VRSGRKLQLINTQLINAHTLKIASSNLLKKNYGAINMLTFEIFLFIILAYIVGIVVEVFIESSTADALTESNSSAVKNRTIVNNEIRLLPNRSGANETKKPILNQVTSAGPVRENTTALLRKGPATTQVIPDNIYLGAATIALVIVTAILVCATWYYAIQTKKILNETRNTVNEMKRATEVHFLPSLITTFNTSTDGDLSLNTKNIGRGPAKQIRVRISITGNVSRQEERNIPLIEPGQIEQYFIDAGYHKSENTTGYDKQEIYEYYKQHQTTLTIKLDYKDILEKEYGPTEQIIDVTKEIKKT